MSRGLWMKLGVLGVTSLLMLGFLEIALRQVFVVPPTWIDPQITHLESPLLGWALPPGIDAYTIDAPVSVNDLGYRDDSFPVEKPEGEIRVLGLGDSFTFALGVEFEDLWVQQLERALAEGREEPVQVINAGVAGYNTRQELILLETDGWAFDPDLVVVGLYWNDLVGNEEPLPDYATTPRYPPERLAWERGERDQTHLIPSFIRDRLRQSVLIYQATTGLKRLLAAGEEPLGPYGSVQKALLEGDESFLEDHWRATGERLLQIAAAAEAKDVPVILMRFPMENEIKFDFPKMRMGEALEEIWAPTGQPYVDLGPAYRTSLEAGENPFLPYDLHPNRVGMRIARDAILEVIEQQGYLQPGPVGLEDTRVSAAPAS